MNKEDEWFLSKNNIVHKKVYLEWSEDWVDHKFYVMQDAKWHVVAYGNDQWQNNLSFNERSMKQITKAEAFLVML